MSSFVSGKGPSMTVLWLPEKRTRLPLELGWRPSPASMTPAFTSSSLYLPMSARIFSLGIWPASDSLLALTITMTLIGLLLLALAAGRTCLANRRFDHRFLRGRRTTTCPIDTRDAFFFDLPPCPTKAERIQYVVARRRP